MQYVNDPVALAAHYAEPAAANAMPARGSLDAEDMAMLAVATLLVVSTVARDGLGCSPRGGRAGQTALVRDERTIWLADDAIGRLHETVTNLLVDPRIGVLVMVPGRHDTLRIRGTARITVDPDAIAAFGNPEVPPRSVIVIDVADVRRAGRGPLRRAGLWADDGPGGGHGQRTEPADGDV